MLQLWHGAAYHLRESNQHQHIQKLEDLLPNNRIIIDSHNHVSNTCCQWQWAITKFYCIAIHLITEFNGINRCHINVATLISVLMLYDYYLFVLFKLNTEFGWGFWNSLEHTYVTTQLPFVLCNERYQLIFSLFFSHFYTLITKNRLKCTWFTDLFADDLKRTMNLHNWLVHIINIEMFELKPSRNSLPKNKEYWNIIFFLIK